MKKDKCLPQVNNSNRQTESAGEPQQEMSSSNSNTTATRGQHVEKDIRKTRMTKIKNRGRNAYRRWTTGEEPSVGSRAGGSGRFNSIRRTGSISCRNRRGIYTREHPVDRSPSGRIPQWVTHPVSHSSCGSIVRWVDHPEGRSSGSKGQNIGKNKPINCPRSYHVHKKKKYKNPTEG